MRIWDKLLSQEQLIEKSRVDSYVPAIVITPLYGVADFENAGTFSGTPQSTLALISEYFEETNGTVVNGTFTDAGNKQWSGDVEFTIQSGQMICSAVNKVIGFDAGLADHSLNIDMSVGQGPAGLVNRATVYLHYEDANNHVRCEARHFDTGTQQLRVREVIGGVDQTHNTQTLTNVDLMQSYTFNVTGAVVQAWQKDNKAATLCQITMTDAGIIAATGLRVSSGIEGNTTGLAFDNFEYNTTVGITSDAAFTNVTRMVAPPVGGAGYAPFYASSFNAGALGTDPGLTSDFVATNQIQVPVYSNDVSGPFGSSQVVKQVGAADKKFWGGRIANFPALAAGDEIWVRWYEYFPDIDGLGFMWAGAGNGEINDPLKWMRFQYTSTSTRLTLEMLGDGDCASPCATGRTTLKTSHVAGEQMGWTIPEGRHNGVNAGVVSGTYARDQWHAIQVYMRLDDGDTVNGDEDPVIGGGLIRVWIDTDLVGEINRNTLPPAGHAFAGDVPTSLWWGNYWNGGYPRDQYHYLDECIMTTQTPDGVDGSGNAYIDPNTPSTIFA